MFVENSFCNFSPDKMGIETDKSSSSQSTAGDSDKINKKLNSLEDTSDTDESDSAFLKKKDMMNWKIQHHLKLLSMTTLKSRLSITW